MAPRLQSHIWFWNTSQWNSDKIQPKVFSSIIFAIFQSAPIVVITLVRRVWLAPWSNRTTATSSWPSLAVTCSAVHMSLDVAFGWAPCCSSRATLSTLPSLAEMCSAVCCSCKWTFQSLPGERRIKISLKKSHTYWLVHNSNQYFCRTCAGF